MKGETKLKSISDESRTISLLRGLAIILVVLGHAMIPDIRTQNKVVDYIWNGLYSFHMFVFFWISGYLFEKGKEKYRQNIRSFIKKKFNLLIIPFIVLTVCEYSLLVINKFAIGQKLFSFIDLGDCTIYDFLNALCFDYGHFDTHLWFIYVLFFIFMINIFFPCFCSSRPYFIILLFCSVLYPFFALCRFPIKSISYWAMPFLVGRLCYQKELLNYMSCLKGHYLALIGVCFIFLNIIINFMGNLTFENSIMEFTRIGFCNEIKHITGFMGVVLLLTLVRRISSSKIKRVLMALDTYSYDIYLLHQPFITVGIAKALLKLNVNTFGIVVLTTVMGILIPIIIAKFVIRRNRFLCRAFLGKHI